MAEPEKIKDRDEPPITLANLGESVSSTPLGDLDDIQRVLLAYTEEKVRRECEAAKTQVEIERAQYKERHEASLKELKNILTIVRVADFVKLIPSVCIVYIIAVYRKEGVSILENPLATTVIVVFIFSIVYLSMSWWGFSQRAKEIKTELEREK